MTIHMAGMPTLQSEQSLHMGFGKYVEHYIYDEEISENGVKLELVESLWISSIFTTNNFGQN